MIFSGFTGKIICQEVNSVEKVKVIEPFLKADEVHIQKDSEENLWITTPVRIMKYNSVEIQDFNKFRGVPARIGKEFIATYTDSENKTWLSGNMGLGIFNPEKNEFEFVSDITGRIYAMKQDTGNQLWIAAENGIFKLNIDSNKNDFGISRFLSENTMAVDIALFQNKVIFAGPNGILSIDRRSGKFNKVDTGYFQDLPISSIQPFGENILVGTSGKGLFKLDSDLKNLQKVYSLPAEISRKEIKGMQDFNEEILIAVKGYGILRLNKDLVIIPNDLEYPDNIYCILLDKSNLLWMVTRNGLYVSNYSGNTVKKLIHDPARYSSLANDFVFAAENDSQDNIWFGTGSGLSIWDTNTDRWRHIKNLNFKRHFNEPDEVTDLASNGDHMWVATANDGVYKLNVQTLLRAHYAPDALYKTEIQSANALFIDAEDNVWVGGEDGYLTRISPSNQVKTFPIIEVQAIAELGPRKIIVATKSRVHLLDPSTGRITDLEKLTATEGMNFYAINDLKITESGLGLFATKGAGLLNYNFENEELKVLAKKDGLPSNNINAVEIDRENGYWLTSDNGLAFYDPETGNIRIYNELNGLSSNELNTGFARLKDGNFAIGSSRGVNIFKPKTMLAQQEFKPRLELKSFLLPKDKENGKIDLAEKQEVDIDENSGFKISFAGISHLSPESIQFSWKLEGLEEEWTKPTSINHANYANLAPGIYTFKVRAKLPNTGWSQPQSIKVNVAAVGGTVNSVYLFMGISVMAMVAIFVVVFIKRSRSADLAAREELRRKLQKEFKKPVENAVKSLNQISAEGDPEDLQRYAARFDDLFNQILNFNYQGSVYEISKINLQVHIPKVIEDIKPVYKSRELEVILNDQWGESEFYYNMELLDKVIFSLISGSAGYCNPGGKIIVNLIETSIGDLKIQVTDNGRGIPESDIKVLERKKSIQSYNMRKDNSGLRYILKAKELIFGSEGSFTYESEKNEGSTFTAVLKNKKEDYRKVPQRAASILKNQNSKPELDSKVPEAFKNLSESRILIIEVDNSFREMLVKNIGKYCQVYQAVTAEEGLEKAAMIFPDIIISATMLEDMNAFQLSKMIKRNTGLNHITMFLLAEEDQQINEMQLEEMTEVLKKPLNINLLFRRITEVLIWQNNLREGFVKSYLDNSKPEFRSEVDKKFIQSLNDIVIQNIKNDNFSVHDLSASQGITSNTLFMKLKSLIDLSPQDFMEFVRLNYARDLMEHTDMNVMEIAYKSGFSSPGILYAAFRKFYGYNLEDSLEKNLK